MGVIAQELLKNNNLNKFIAQEVLKEGDLSVIAQEGPLN